MAKFRFNHYIDIHWNGYDIVGDAGTIFSIPDQLYEEFESDLRPVEPSLEWTVVNEFLELQNAVSVTTLEAVAPIVVTPTSTGRSISLNANYSTTSHLHTGTYQPAGTYVTSVSGTAPITSSGTTAITVGIDQTTITAAAATSALNTRTLVRNSTASTIAKGSVVYLSSSNGIVPTIEKALATSDATSSRTFGIVQQDISANSNGYVINQGIIDPIDTSGIADGSVLWLSTTVAGGYSTVKPVGPNHGVLVGVCVKGNSVGNGSIYIFIKNGAELDEIHDVNISSVVNGQALVWSSSQSVWINQAINTAIASITGTAPIVASTTSDKATTISVSTGTTSSTVATGNHLHTGTYANASHNHATSDVNSGNFVATLAAGTGVTVTGADANAAAKTVSIGQAVATSDAVTFASVNKLAITAPATSATLAIANTKTLTVSNTMTLTGVDSSSANIGNGGALVPAGVVHIYMGANTSLPTGWLLCDGTAVSRTTYATLFGVIGTNFGTGDGSTTFNLPDLTGNLLVGSSGIPGTTFQAGTTDAYLNASWTHAHSHSHVTNPAATTSGTPSLTVTSLTQTGAGTAGANNHTHSTDIAATTSDTDATNSPTITVKRTRVNYIIKW